MLPKTDQRQKGKTPAPCKSNIKGFCSIVAKGVVLTSAEHSGTAFTPWVTLKGDYTPDVYRPFRPGTPTRQLKSTL
ncbi:hypothetical protein TNCV_2838491 [Trichonephila clavipes]|nr:hypothetical protein TNCV_2838491 [Trichonephila clavipes]